jgi:ATP synthase protein I
MDMGRLHLRGGSLALGLIAAQAVTAAVATLVVAVFWGGAAAWAALFGGITVIVPTLYFAAKVYLRAGGSPDVKDVLGAFYKAEMGKLLLIALLFGIGAKVFGAHFAPLMLTAIACLAMNWLMVALARDE